MTIVAAETCPYCGRPYSEGNGPTRDHAFVEAMGGRAVVTACRDCNSRIGAEIEGKLLKQGTVLNFVRQFQGAGQPLRGRLGEDGPEIEHRLGEPEVHFHKPVTKTVSDNAANYRLTAGTQQAKDQLDQLAKGLGLNTQQVEGLWSSRSVRSLKGANVTTGVNYDFALARRLAAKVALGACWLAFGDAFASGALASEMRAFLWSDGDMNATSCSSEALAVFDETILGPPFPSSGPGSIPPLSPSGPMSQVVLFPNSHRLATIVHLGGWDLTLIAAPMFSAPLPGGGRFPVLVRDGTPNVLVRSVDSELTTALLARQDTEPHSRPESDSG